MSMRVCYYNVAGILISEQIVHSDTSPLPEVRDAVALRIVRADEEAPKTMSEHGAGCTCETCIQVLCTSNYLDDRRIARKMLRYAALQTEQWREWAYVTRRGEVWKRWQVHRERMRLRRKIEELEQLGKPPISSL